MTGSALLLNIFAGAAGHEEYEPYPFNAHYHQPSDTPETLDYTFIKKVTDLLVLHCVEILKL